MATKASESITLKLLIDSEGRKVLFAEAGKEFADFLFTLLSLPVGTVIRLLSSNAMVGSLGNLYDSFNSLSKTYVQPNVNKDVLLKPESAMATSSVPLLSLAVDQSTSANAPAAQPLPGAEGGIVKGVVTYMIMDNLEVKPMSTISSITMLNRFSVKDVGSLQEKTVTLNMKMGLKLLKASLETENVLTNVFLGK